MTQQDELEYELWYLETSWIDRNQQELYMEEKECQKKH